MHCRMCGWQRGRCLALLCFFFTTDRNRFACPATARSGASMTLFSDVIGKARVSSSKPEGQPACLFLECLACQNDSCTQFHVAAVLSRSWLQNATKRHLSSVQCRDERHFARATLSAGTSVGRLPEKNAALGAGLKLSTGTLFWNGGVRGRALQSDIQSCCQTPVMGRDQFCDPEDTSALYRCSCWLVQHIFGMLVAIADMSSPRRCRCRNRATSGRTRACGTGCATGRSLAPARSCRAPASGHPGCGLGSSQIAASRVCAGLRLAFPRQRWQRQPHAIRALTDRHFAEVLYAPPADAIWRMDVDAVGNARGAGGARVADNVFQQWYCLHLGSRNCPPPHADAIWFAHIGAGGGARGAGGWQRPQRVGPYAAGAREGAGLHCAGAAAAARLHTIRR